MLSITLFKNLKLGVMIACQKDIFLFKHAPISNPTTIDKYYIFAEF